MLTYIVRRVLIGSVTLLLITVVVYALIRHMPGTPLTAAMTEMDPSKKLNPEDYERMRRAYGLDKPWYSAYFVWLGNVLRFDLGQSFAHKQPVTRVIGERLGPTLALSVSSLVLMYLLSIPLGLYSTARSGAPDERAISLLLYMLYSFPTFVAALLLQMTFAQYFDLLPLYHMHDDLEVYQQLSPAGKTWDLFKHALLPTACETYGGLAYYSRFIRANMMEVIRQDYVRTARAKGVGEARVVLVHAFRNTLIPLVTMVGLTLPSLLGGSVIIERIFVWPGIGNLFFDSITARDYPVIMCLTLVFSLLTLAGTLLADVLYAVVDPRVSYS
ncbi:MAG TPA: ABC transporter permease [Pirellulales bacterium]|jgi:peptide/nickel transport system permease protein|nr:ABC transporter permease [Pirellulales bacterium]